MRVAFITLNLLVATASAAMFVYSFFAREHLTKLTEDYVVRKTVKYATPGVEQIEGALNHPAVLLAPVAVRRAVRAEVNAFHNDPNHYVRQLVARGAAVENPGHAFAERVLAWKARTRAYFDRTLASLIRDFRIFTGTNAAAALLAAWAASQARGRFRWHLAGVSLLLLGALLLQAYFFVNSLTFFRIVTNARVGWSYPLAVVLTFAILYSRFGRLVPLAANPSGHVSPVVGPPSGGAASPEGRDRSASSPSL